MEFSIEYISTVHYRGCMRGNAPFTAKEWGPHNSSTCVVYHSISQKTWYLTAGMAEISDLFNQADVNPEMKDRYITLLEKFEVALKINDHQMIIPALMPERVSYPKPDANFSDVSKSKLEHVEKYYQPPLSRFWLTDFVPVGFWPRLIVRVVTDQQIEKVEAFMKLIFTAFQLLIFAGPTNRCGPTIL